MRVAIIFAGGIGRRMEGCPLPKQFLKLQGKPILVYTLERFQNHRQIDGIVLVSVKEWIEYCRKLVEEFALTKVWAIVPGGATAQQSIYNGLCEAERLCPKDSIVLIHDGVRPLVERETIDAAIACTEKNGSAVTVSLASETVMLEGPDGTAEAIIDRKWCRVVKAPQCFFLGDILQAHRQANLQGLDDFIDSASLMAYFGKKLFTVQDTERNIKITTPTDFCVFKAFIEGDA